MYFQQPLSVPPAPLLINKWTAISRHRWGNDWPSGPECKEDTAPLYLHLTHLCVYWSMQIHLFWFSYFPSFLYLLSFFQVWCLQYCNVYFAGRSITQFWVFMLPVFVVDFLTMFIVCVIREGKINDKRKHTLKRNPVICHLIWVKTEVSDANCFVNIQVTLPLSSHQ